MVRDEQHWRIQKSGRFLSAAHRAFDGEDWETAVSRGYYAVYHAVIALLELKTDLGIPRRHATLHNLLVSREANHLLPRTDVKEFRELFTAREVADYEDESLSRALAENWLSTAERLCRVVEKVIANG